MKCPHCKSNMYPRTTTSDLGADSEGTWQLIQHCCPGCGRFSFIFHLQCKSVNPMTNRENKNYLVWPKGIARDPVPTEVPDDLIDDYKEACLVLADSAKASAALSRRCLQHLIREYAKITKANLDQEITTLLPMLPSYIAESVDAIRTVGNFAAHPIKSTSTGEIVEVEPGEAEWNLEVLESLFDFYFVQPKRIQTKRNQLNKKLTDAGKPELKSSTLKTP